MPNTKLLIYALEQMADRLRRENETAEARAKELREKEGSDAQNGYELGSAKAMAICYGRIEQDIRVLIIALAEES